VLGLFTSEVPREVTEPQSQHLFHRAALRPGAVLFLGLIPLAGFTAFMPLYVDTLGIGAGPVFLLYGVLILVVRIVGARLPDRIGGLRAGAGALGLAAVGIGVVAAWPTVSGLIVGTVILAGGMSLMYPALLLLALTGVSDADRASVVGTFSSFFDASQGVGAFICGVAAAIAGNRGAFAIGAITATLGFFLLRRGQGAPTVAVAG
jgi:predicted MFS family arabinose efflux permease